MSKLLILIKKDFFRYYGRLSLFLFIRTLYVPSYRYLFYLRLIQSSMPLPLKYLFIILKYRCSRKYGFQIPNTTKIGGGLYIGHYGTIVINESATIGENCNITHNVTIGQTNRGKLKGTPIIGSGVWIGSGVVIVGGITIGDNVLIAPNSYVNCNIPSDSLVYGNPCIIKHSTKACDNYIENILYE